MAAARNVTISFRGARVGLAATLAAGLVANVIFLAALASRWRVGLNDFMGFYSSGKLAWSGHLYDAQAHYAVQRAATNGGFGEAWLFVRLPFYAAFLWPFARLSYPTAWIVFLLVCLAAIVGFIWLWPTRNRRLLALLTATNLPLCHSLINGQDVAPLLLWLAGGVALSTRGWPVLAGMAWSLLGAKPHLFIFLPVVLIASRRWRELAGLSLGGFLLLGLSFTVGGTAWPTQFQTAIALPALHQWSQMPNLELFTGGAGARWFYLLGGPIFAALLWRLAKRVDLALLIAASIAPGILLAPHVYLADCALLLPLGALLASAASEPKATWLGLAILSPIYFLLPFGPPYAFAVPLLILAALFRLLRDSSSRNFDSHFAARIQPGEVAGGDGFPRADTL